MERRSAAALSVDFRGRALAREGVVLAGGNEAVALDKVWARAWNRRVNANAAIGSDAPNFALRVSSTELSKAGGWQRPNWVPDKTPAREEIGKHLKTAKGDKKRGGKRKGQLWTSSVGVIDKRVK